MPDCTVWSFFLPFAPPRKKRAAARFGRSSLQGCLCWIGTALVRGKPCTQGAYYVYCNVCNNKMQVQRSKIGNVHIMV